MKQYAFPGFFLLMLLSLSLPTAAAQSSTSTSTINLQNDDRVVFVGDGLFENELDYGYLEYVLTTTWPRQHLEFRNIGWSADTPAGTSRDHFTNPPTPYEHLFEQIRATNPTVAFVGYGAHLAFEDAAALDPFTTDLHALLDSLDAMDVRTILVSPAPHEPESSPVPSVATFNERLAAVSKRLSEVAATRDLAFVDLYAGLIDAANDPVIHISDQGHVLNAHGYYLAAHTLAEYLPAVIRSQSITIDTRSETVSPQISNYNATGKTYTFSIDDDVLPLPVPVSMARLSHFKTAPQTLRVTGLPRGDYGVWIGNDKVAVASARELADGIRIATPHAGVVQELQRLIHKKNRTYFNQYRPQNETYLVGFREYEQGNNARELQLLDPLIGKQENEISRLKIPNAIAVRIQGE